MVLLQVSACSRSALCPYHLQASIAAGIASSKGNLAAALRRFREALALQHLSRARALQPIAQRAVRIDFLVTDKALISICDRIQAATTALDCPTHQKHTGCHAQHDQHQKPECEKKRGHSCAFFGSLGCQELELAARRRLEPGPFSVRHPLGELDRDPSLFSQREALLLTERMECSGPSISQHCILRQNRC